MQTCLKALERAIQSDNYENLSLLLSEGKELFQDPFSGLDDHAHLLYQAIRGGNHKMVEALVQIPVYSDICFYRLCGNSPLGLAFELDLKTLFPLLIAHTDIQFAGYVAIKLKQKALIQYLKDRLLLSSRITRHLALDA